MVKKNEKKEVLDGVLIDTLLAAFVHDISSSMCILEFYVTAEEDVKDSTLQSAASAAVEHIFAMVSAAKKARETMGASDHLRNYELGDALNSLASLFGAIAEYKKVDFSSRLPDGFVYGVGASYCELMILTYNLMSNACNAVLKKASMGDQSFRPRIELRMSAAQTGYEILISDNGSGMSPECLSEFRTKKGRAFDKGAPVDFCKGKGLSIVNGILAVRGGSLIATSDDSGSDLTLAIPFYKNFSGQTADR